jgi:hypothetical protein
VAIEQILRLEFGKDGQSEDRVGAGWSLAETSHRWMVGPYSELRLGPFVAGSDYFFTLEVEPFIKPPTLETQRLSISIGGVPFIQTELTAGGRFGYRIPAELITADGDLVMVFDHPDAARPSDLAGLKDHRPLAISVSSIELWRLPETSESAIIEGGGGLSIAETEQRIGLPVSEFITRFESLGENCEFGLAQRRCGAEPLSLLRFANTLLPSLLRGLRTSFVGLGEPADLAFRLEGRTKPEYIIQEQGYGLVYHTFRYKGEIDEDKFIASESARLRFLVRKFVEDLQGGEKIFVIKRNTPLLEEEILPVVAALNAYGPNTLLWVALADDKHPPGSAQWVMPGLIKGYIDRFAPNENAHDLSLDIWLEICVNVFALWRPQTRG